MNDAEKVQEKVQGSIFLFIMTWSWQARVLLPGVLEVLKLIQSSQDSAHVYCKVDHR